MLVQCGRRMDEALGYLREPLRPGALFRARQHVEQSGI